MRRRKGFRWSRQGTGRFGRGRKRNIQGLSHYSYDANNAGEPMLSWAQAQQTVRLDRGSSSDRHTIAMELDIKEDLSHHKERAQKIAKKATVALPTSKDSYDPVEHFQKLVNEVPPPPDAHQECYVCDEEDHEVLKLINSKPRFTRVGPLNTQVFEDVITQLERESTKCRGGGNSSFNLPVDEDAVCCVCQKGDCDNTNMILFCDVCNLAVHQECYGVPYIPEGQWNCRRCLVNSAAARCLLCPNADGAMKQTEDGHWAHVICAMYMPRVTFKSPQLLEPVMNIDKIEKSRWKLKCIVCKAKEGYKRDDHMGACIQCKDPSCKTSFHVTCAQKAGYYLDLKPVKDDEENEDDDDSVEAIAFCEKHSRQQRRRERKKSPDKSSRNGDAPTKAQQQQNRVESLTIDPERLEMIARSVKLHEKPELFKVILAYWKSKRRYRNGVPLMKRPRGRNMATNRAVNQEELERMREFIKLALRTSEKLRTLTEYNLRQNKTNFRKDKLCDVRQHFEMLPGKSVLDHLFGRIKTADKEGYFALPVTDKIAPQYSTIIKHPMSFFAMSEKLDNGKYRSFEEFQGDVELIISNCFKYNTPDTIFHQYALKFQEAAIPMLDIGRKDYEDFVGRTRATLDDLISSPSNVQDSNIMEDVVENGVSVHGREEDDLLSEISAPEEPPDIPKELPRQSAEVSKSLTIDKSPVVNGNQISSSHSPNNSRLIPSSPRSRKTPLSHDDSNDGDKSTPRKRARTTPGDAEEVGSSSSQVPGPQISQLSPPPRTMGPYRNLLHFASESEPDPPLASEDSTDLPSSDCDFDSDGPAHNLRSTLKTIPDLSRAYFEIRNKDFVWAKIPGNNLSYPAFVVDPRAFKGYAFSNGNSIKEPPRSVLEAKKTAEKKLPGHLCLVNLFDAKRSWAWVQRDKLEFMYVDRAQDAAKLTDPRVKKAYDLASKCVDGDSLSPARVASSPVEQGASDPED